MEQKGKNLPDLDFQIFFVKEGPYDTSDLFSKQVS